MRKVLALLLSLVMTLTLLVPATWAEEKPAAGYQLPASLKGKTVILHTNDVHGAIDKYAKVAALKNECYDRGASAVVLLDAGDFSQGSTYVSLSKGATAVELMNAVGYDAVTLGNHEFDYGFPQLKANLSYSAADFLVTCVNLVDDEGAPIFAPGATAPVTDADDNPLFNLTVMGVATPETQTKANPALMKGLTFLSGQKLYDAANAVIKVAREEGNADIVIALTHLGVDASSEPNRSIDFVKNVPGVDIVIDGHSHTVMENKQVADASGRLVTLTQTGSYFANVGEMTIAPDGTISTRLVSTYDQEDVAVAAEQAAWVNTVDDMLGEKIAVADTKFYITDPATGKRRIRSGETNLGDFVADGIYTYFNEVEQLHCDIAIMNGGGIRSDEDAGYWTFKTCKQVSPFGNVACLMSVTGKQIQDALEFAARFAGAEGKENGGFLQVAGATYEIHTDIPNTVQTDDKNVWIGSATGTPRVQNVKIYDRANGTYVPLDENKTYALAGMNYTLRNLGDGFAMFDGAELIKDYVSEDYLVMSTYAMTFGGVDAEGLPHLSSANSVLAEYPGYLLDYENPYGAGRISIL